MVTVRKFTESDKTNWDTYVCSHPTANLYQLSGWENVIEKTYGHKCYYLMALRPATSAACPSSNSIAGIFPLVHMNHFLFDNSLVSMPFFDLGGILADNEETEAALLTETVRLCGELNVNTIELRETKPMPWKHDSSKLETEISKQSSISYGLSALNWVTQTRSHKVRMLLKLPDSSDTLMKSFKSKLRSQIKKPIKEGLKVKIGGLEFLEDFYKVFTINMRDLGSPVHSKNLIQNVLNEFKEKAKIMIVYKDQQPAASSLVVGFNDTLENPWASALRKYSRLSPNMLLYWSMLEYACDNGYKYFDFGRSTPDGGTYKFKKQWGAKPEPLNWIQISLKHGKTKNSISEDSKFQLASGIWKRLPVAVTKILGPRIRKYISL